MTEVRIPTSAVAPWDELYVNMLELESEWRRLCRRYPWRCLRNLFLVLVIDLRLARARRLAGEMYAARQRVAFLVSSDSPGWIDNGREKVEKRKSLLRQGRLEKGDMGVGSERL